MHKCCSDEGYNRSRDSPRMAVIASSDLIGASPSSTSLRGLDGINFFLAGMQSGFGPLVAVLLADEKWTQQNIGFVLSLGGFAGLLSQLPGGELLDATRSKRFLIALGGIMVAVSAFLIRGLAGRQLGLARNGWVRKKTCPAAGAERLHDVDCFLYCRFIPDMLAMTERLNLRQGSATIADSHGATVGRGCSRKKRSISLAASGPRGSV